jgi:Rod binding domain-containing protein
MTVQQILQNANVTTLPVGTPPGAVTGSATLAAAPGADTKTAKLVNAAQEFEAMMLNEMLKPLHFGSGVEDGSEESAGGAAETIRGMGTDALGKALASHGGLGIARKIVADVTKERDHAKAQMKGAKVQ